MSIDAVVFDLDGVLEWLRRWRANVYAVNGGGLSAFYQTRVPLQRQNPYLGGRDLFKEVVDAIGGVTVNINEPIAIGGNPFRSRTLDWRGYLPVPSQGETSETNRSIPTFLAID